MQATTKQKYLVSTNKLGTLLSSQTTDTQESTPRKPTHTTCKRRKITRTLHSRADTHTTTNFPKEQNQVNTQRPCRETLDGPQPGKQRYARYETPKPEQQQAASRGLKGYCPPDTPVTGTPSWRATGKYSTHTHTKKQNRALRYLISAKRSAESQGKTPPEHVMTDVSRGVRAKN